jgi:phage-related protein
MDPEIEGRDDGAERVPGRMARGAAVAVILPFYLAWDVGRRLTKAMARALVASWRRLMSRLVMVPPALGTLLEPMALVVDGLVGGIIAAVGATASIGRAIRTILVPVRWTIRAATTALEMVMAGIGRVVAAVLAPCRRAAAILSSVITSLLGSVGQVISRAFALIVWTLAPVGAAIATLVRAALPALRELGRRMWMAAGAVGRGLHRVLVRLADLVSAVLWGIGLVVAEVARVVGPPTMRILGAAVSFGERAVSIVARGIRRVWLSVGAVAAWIARRMVVPIASGLARIIGPVVRQVRLAIRVAGQTVRVRIVGPLKRELEAMAAGVRSAFDAAARARADAVALIRARFGRRGAR